ncbi:hypothetical protein [Halorussus aquaticus]|uniref:TrmB family transcriptional regulator n=1 Tax=Halorussus aquaticus TaxID=2953748 RepID=A0ABD5Q2Z8_9EURY|nr:hypothetical protein [Halorussus aquaticus]
MATTEALITLYLQTAGGGATTDDIVDDLPIGKLTLHSILPRMTDAGTVERQGDYVSLQ